MNHSYAETIIECDSCHNAATIFTVVSEVDGSWQSYWAECQEHYRSPTSGIRIETHITKQEYLTWLIESRL
jgi:hypothetical protein